MFLWSELGICLMVLIFSDSTIGNHHKISISPSASDVVHFVNDSHIVTCNGPKDTLVSWINPRGDIVSDKKGRIHIEEMSSGQLALVFEHISLSDKGEWTCASEDGSKSFKMVISQPISFMNTPVVQTGHEGKDTHIRCEAKGDPDPTVSWSFNGQAISLPHNKFARLADGLLVKSATRNDSGEYTCRAFQVSETISSVKEQTIRLNIQHKPVAPLRKASAAFQYGYINGTVNLTCEAEAQPHATFSWFRLGKKINPKYHQIYTGNHSSMLEIIINGSSAFGDYKCRASNSLGQLDRIITLQEGIKPEKPSQVILRGVNSDTFDIDVAAIRTSNKRHEMDINGYRFEMIPEQTFIANDGKWDDAQVIDFGFEDGVTFLINNLSANTTYLVRVASKNLAGLSDWTQPSKFRTHSKEPVMYTSGTNQKLNNYQMIFSIGIALIFQKSNLFNSLKFIDLEFQDSL